MFRVVLLRYYLGRREEVVIGGFTFIWYPDWADFSGIPTESLASGRKKPYKVAVRTGIKSCDLHTTSPPRGIMCRRCIEYDLKRYYCLTRTSFAVSAHRASVKSFDFRSTTGTVFTSYRAVVLHETTRTEWYIILLGVNLNVLVTTIRGYI